MWRFGSSMRGAVCWIFTRPVELHLRQDTVLGGWIPLAGCSKEPWPDTRRMVRIVHRVQHIQLRRDAGAMSHACCIHGTATCFRAPHRPITGATVGGLHRQHSASHSSSFCLGLPSVSILCRLLVRGRKPTNAPTNSVTGFSALVSRKHSPPAHPRRPFVPAHGSGGFLSSSTSTKSRCFCFGGLLALVLWCLENTAFQTLAFRSAVSQ